MSQDVNRVVITYLRKKGYEKTEEIFREEAKIASSQEVLAVAESVLQSQLPALCGTGSGTDISFIVMYGKIKRWVEDSLDLYKNELMLVLYPLFVHCYLELVSRKQNKEAKQFLELFQNDHLVAHKSDIQRISAVTTVQHLKENETCQTYRANKYSLPMCRYAFELFISFLQENRYLEALKLVNQYLDIKVYVGNPRSTEEEHGVMQIEQENEDEQERISYGPMQPDPQLWQDIERVLRDDLLSNGVNPEETQRTVDQFKRMKPVADAESPDRERVPLPPVKRDDVMAEIRKLKEQRHRISLGPSSLPSVCCFTWYNTFDTLNSLTFSPDSTLIGAGFSDSTIEVSSLTGRNLTGLKSSIQIGTLGINEVMDLEDFKEEEGTDVKRLIGHSGPVYATGFSPDNRFLFSSSQDGTARLWSLDTFTNIVAYKGHNYPVWDLDVSPVGFYFCTASHDRTARLWSADHIYPLRIFAGHMSDVDCVKFHPNCNYVATGSSDKSCRLWDIQKGNCVRLFTGHTGSVSSVAFSPDGRYLASASEDKSILIWDLGTGKKVKQCVGHESSIYSIKFSMDGSLLASGGTDSVKLWDVKATEEKLTPLTSLRTKDTPIYTVHYTCRNLLLVGGALETTN